MFLRWDQQRSRKGQPESWKLVHKETGRVVLYIQVSEYGEMFENYLVRRKIKAVYEKYYMKVWFKNLEFF